MGDQDQRQLSTVCGDRLSDLAELALAPFRVVERALQRTPRLPLPEGQAGRVQAAAARARQGRPDRDAVLPERLADPRGLRPAALVQVALGGAVVQPGAGGIEAPGRKAVAQQDDRTRRAQGIPDRLRGLRD